MKKSKVFPGLLVLLLPIVLAACGEIPTPPRVGQPAQQATAPPPPATEPAPTPTITPTAVPATPVPEQPGLTVFRDSGILVVLAAAVHPMNPEIIYVGAYNGLFRSTDGGSS